MKQIIVGIGEAKVSTDPDEILKTYALGSCVAVIVLDPVKKAVGMAHIALPYSHVDETKSKENPSYFADTGIPYLLDLLQNHGSEINDKYMIKLVGGANICDNEDLFQIGKRNVTAIRKILWSKQIPIMAEDVGDIHGRTVSIEVKTGKITVSSSDGTKWGV